MGQDKDKYVTIINRAYVLKGSLSEVGTLSPHNSDTLHGLVSGNTQNTLISIFLVSESIFSLTFYIFLKVAPYSFTIDMRSINILQGFIRDKYGVYTCLMLKLL